MVYQSIVSKKRVNQVELGCHEVNYASLRLLQYFHFIEDYTNNTMSKTPQESKDQHPLFNKSASMNSVLQGKVDLHCSHFVDQLERFRRDFATYHKDQRAVGFQKKKEVQEYKQRQSDDRSYNIEATTNWAEQKKEAQQGLNLHLFDVGLKKNGMTSGIPVNPVNHQYLNSYGGNELRSSESEKHMSDLVRLHHLQSKSTCGYNLINGKENNRVQQLVPSDQVEGMNSRIQTYQEHFRLRPE